MIDLSLIKKNQTIAVALSGGKDSICLLHNLLAIKNDYNLTIKAINIDHSIRGKDSENDSLFVKNYCDKLGVSLAFFKVDAITFSKENGYSLEQGARILRYEVFDNLLKENFCDAIATAHHKSDNFETVLFNIFRGTGLKGLTGIPKTRKNYIRPLLNASRKEIEDYIIKNNIPYVEDATNFDSEYSRNYIRNEIAPKILEKFPSAEDAVSRLSLLAKEEDEFLSQLAFSYIKNENENYYFSTDIPPIMMKRCAKIILSCLGVDKDYESVNLNDVVKLSTLQNGSKINLPKGVVAVKLYSVISFCVQVTPYLIDETPFAVDTFKFHDYSLKITTEFVEKALKFDGDKVPKNAVIRNRKNGDLFTKFGGGTKKLKDFLIDKKVPRYSRDSIPVLAVGNKILAVFGVEISEDIKVDTNTKNILYAKILYE